MYIFHLYLWSTLASVIKNLQRKLTDKESWSDLGKAKTQQLSWDENSDLRSELLAPNDRDNNISVEMAVYVTTTLN